MYCIIGCFYLLEGNMSAKKTERDIAEEVAKMIAGYVFTKELPRLSGILGKAYPNVSENTRYIRALRVLLRALLIVARELKRQLQTISR